MYSCGPRRLFTVHPRIGPWPSKADLTVRDVVHAVFATDGLKMAADPVVEPEPGTASSYRAEIQARPRY